jgi:hypothetical protein
MFFMVLVRILRVCSLALYIKLRRDHVQAAEQYRVDINMDDIQPVILEGDASPHFLPSDHHVYSSSKSADVADLDSIPIV